MKNNINTYDIACLALKSAPRYIEDADLLTDLICKELATDERAEDEGERVGRIAPRHVPGQLARVGAYVGQVCLRDGRGTGAKASQHLAAEEEAARIAASAG